MKIKHLPGQTPLSAEDLEGLIPNLTTQGELNEFEAESILLGRAWAFKSRKLNSDLLTASGLLLLHKNMFGKVWKWAGKFRKSNTSIGVDKAHIQQELKQLIDDVKYWLENKTFPINEIAIRFHHRLVKIHPFSNGNGRFSRLATDLFLKHQKQAAFTWGGGDNNDLRKADKLRDEYIDALQKADKNPDDVHSLLKFATKK